MTTTVPAPRHDATGDPRRHAVVAMAVAFALTVIVYLPILRNMVHHWSVSSDYSHAFIVVPLSILFIYQKRRELARAPIAGSWWGVVPLSIGVVSLAIGQLGSLLTLLRGGFVFALIGLVILLLGLAVFRVVAFPMLFLFLMVPLPQSLVNTIAFPLQLIAARWAVDVLHVIGIPALVEGNIIHLAHTELFVAEACSGLRSLMALVTLGVVFAYFFQQGRIVAQITLCAATIPIAVVVNSARVALTGVLTHRYGTHAASGVIHEFQGIITFTLAFAILMALSRIFDLFYARAAHTDGVRR